MSDRTGVDTAALDAIRELCEKPIHDVEELGLHVAATGNRYGLATEVLPLLDRVSVALEAARQEAAGAKRQVEVWRMRNDSMLRAREERDEALAELAGLRETVTEALERTKAHAIEGQKDLDPQTMALFAGIESISDDALARLRPQTDVSGGESDD